MAFDVLLPLVLFLVGVTTVFLYSRLDHKVDRLFGGQELQPKHVILFVAAIGAMVSIMLVIPDSALLGLFLFAYTAILTLFTFLFVPKWYLSLVPPVLFLVSFFYCWNIYTFNFFALLFAVAIAVYMGNLFTWKTTVAFAGLVTIMDIIQVLFTGHMGEAFETAKTLGLPAFIKIPMFPDAGLTYLGLGDLFLFGLLSIQLARKCGRNFAFKSVIVMGIVYLVLHTVLLNYYPLTSGFPATVLVVICWLTVLAAHYLYSSLFLEKETKTQLG